MSKDPRFHVDAAKCVTCGACVRDCAFKALKSDAEKRPVMAHPARCMLCQHCLSICPAGAVSIDGKKAEDSLRLRDAEFPSAKAVTDWMAFRRSIRQFRPEDVDRASLDAVLRALGNAPTGCNARSLTFTCYPTRAAVKKFTADFIDVLEAPHPHMLPRWLAAPAIRLRRGGGDMFFRGAPGLLIISSDTDNKEVTTPQEDVAAAVTYFEMLANAHGIATCWCGFLRLAQGVVPELLETIAGIPRKHVFAAVLFGTAAVKYPRGVQREGYATVRMMDVP